MKKKVTALCLCVALLAVAVVGASLAYFTDTKSATNTFTVGNVKIDLIESRFPPHRQRRLRRYLPPRSDNECFGHGVRPGQLDDLHQ